MGRELYSFFLEVSYKMDKASRPHLLSGGKRRMQKRLVFTSFMLATLVAVASSSTVGLGNPLSACLPNPHGVVDKVARGTFTVEITFKNMGTTEGKWSVNIAFEGEKWSWKGLQQNLTLKPNITRKLVWNGSVPEDAPADTVARLVVYYDDSFLGLDWWIHVVPGAQLTVTSSTVK
jgi:hypothetical protein